MTQDMRMRLFGLLILLTAVVVGAGFMSFLVWVGPRRVMVVVLLTVGLILMGWCFYKLERQP